MAPTVLVWMCESDLVDRQTVEDTCVCRAGHGCRQVCWLPQHQTDSLGMGFALVVGLGHNGGGEEHVTQGTALVPVHLCLCTVLEEGEEK